MGNFKLGIFAGLLTGRSARVGCRRLVEEDENMPAMPSLPKQIAYLRCGVWMCCLSYFGDIVNCLFKSSSTARISGLTIEEIWFSRKSRWSKGQRETFTG